MDYSHNKLLVFFYQQNHIVNFVAIELRFHLTVFGVIIDKDIRTILMKCMFQEHFCQEFGMVLGYWNPGPLDLHNILSGRCLECRIEKRVERFGHLEFDFVFD